MFKATFLKAAFTVLLMLLCPVSAAVAGEIEPRAYVNTPIDVNFLLAGYVYTDGGLATVGSSPVQDAQLHMHTGIMAYARTFELWGNSGKFDVIVPYSNMSGRALVNGEPRTRNVSGFNDPRFRLSYNFYGAPALTVEEYPAYQQDLLIGASLQVSAPLGQYDKERLVNLGNNRWFFKPDIGISKDWGNFVLEFSGGVTFFTDNDEFYGNKKLEQDPVIGGQLHATYNFGKGIWGAVSGNYDCGGATTTGGKFNNDHLDNSRAGLTLALPVNRNNSIKLYGSTSIHTRVGSDFDLVGIIWQHRWGGGL